MTEKTENQTQNGITHDQIALRAYQLWETGGRLPGRDREYWLMAEAELAKRQEPASEGALEAASAERARPLPTSERPARRAVSAETPMPEREREDAPSRPNLPRKSRNPGIPRAKLPRSVRSHRMP